jgi:hypothetical protein
MFMCCIHVIHSANQNLLSGKRMRARAQQVLCVTVCAALAAAALAHTHRTTSTANEHMPCMCPMKYLQQFYLHPQHILQTSSTCPITTTQQYKHQFASILLNQSVTDSIRHKDLQLLCSAFLLRMLALRNKGVESEVGSRCTVCMQTSARARVAGVASVAAAQDECALMRERAERAESAATLLSQQALQREEAIMHLQSSRDALRGQLAAAQLRSRCAPVYFDLLIEFIKSRCVTGGETKIGSAELHQAFDSFMQHAQRNQPAAMVVPVPKQSELRALMETLGFEYSQVYHNGTNTRCLRGIQLQLSPQGAKVPA